MNARSVLAWIFATGTLTWWLWHNGHVTVDNWPQYAPGIVIVTTLAVWAFRPLLRSRYAP